MTNIDQTAQRHVEGRPAEPLDLEAEVLSGRMGVDAARRLVGLDPLPTNDNVPVAAQPARPVTFQKGDKVGLLCDKPQYTYDREHHRLAGNSIVLTHRGEEMLFWTHNLRHAAPPRRGDFMQVYTGKQFWPLDPRPSEVDIRDIAHALAQQSRYGGHGLRFYSVAEHCVHIARWLEPHGTEAAFYGLMHDAAEAYLADVPRPLKRHLAGYKDAERAVMAVICEALGMAPEDDWPPIVHEADERILADEVRQNMTPMDWHAKHDNPLGVRLEFWEPAVAEVYFLDTFRRLKMARIVAAEGDRRVAA